MDIAKETRAPIRTSPGGSFTMTREKAKQTQDVKLLEHFAQWISSYTGEPVKGETIHVDLKNGVALCKLMMSIPGSEVTKFHTLGAKNAAMDEFKSRENVNQFQRACQKLKLPQTFGYAELEAGNFGQIASTLVFVAHTAFTHDVGRASMDETLTERIEEVEAAMVDVLNTPASPSDQQQQEQTNAANNAGDVETALEAQKAGRELTWWQKLLIRFGFGDYVDMDAQKLREYAENLKARIQQRAADAKQQVDAKTLESKNSFNEKLGGLKKSLSETVAPHLDKLPASVSERVQKALAT